MSKVPPSPASPTTKAFFPRRLKAERIPVATAAVFSNAVNDAEVVVREIPAGARGTYYFVVNTSMRPRTRVVIKFPVSGVIRDLVEHQDLPTGSLKLDLYPGELRSYLVRAASEKPGS